MNQDRHIAHPRHEERYIEEAKTEQEQRDTNNTKTIMAYAQIFVYVLYTI